MPRLFLALNLTDSLKNQLSLLPGSISGARWLESEQYHITLKYIGESSAADLSRIERVLERREFRVLNIQLKGVGLFPLRGSPETLWVGVHPYPDLMRLQREIEKGLYEIGFPREGRHYFPHVSLARLREPSLPDLAGFLARHATLNWEPEAISSYSLYSSHGTSMGSHYIEEIRFPLFGVTGEEDEANGEEDEEDGWAT